MSLWVKVYAFIQPIRTPGAVQGFGVLIAVKEDEVSGNLIVRQVSEVCVTMSGDMLQSAYPLLIELV